MTHIEELEKIRLDHGGVLRAADVVEFARNPRTALHARFTWDDSRAAHEYRLSQARELIRVVISVHPAINKPTRVYVSVESDRKKGGGYRTMNEVMTNPDYRDELLDEARVDMERFQAKYAVLDELAGVFAAMNEAVSRPRKGGKKRATA